MPIWAIADLHLSFARPEPRDQYAGRWRDHAERIAGRWREVVGRDDLVLIPGDISMARNHRDVQPDLGWLARLPGTKVLSAGNHDAWFNAVGKVRPILRRGLLAVGGDAVQTHGVVVCGAKSGPVQEVDCLKPLDAAIASALAMSRSTPCGTTRRSTSTGVPAPRRPGSRRRGCRRSCTGICTSRGSGERRSRGSWTG